MRWFHGLPPHHNRHSDIQDHARADPFSKGAGHTAPARIALGGKIVKVEHYNAIMRAQMSRRRMLQGAASVGAIAAVSGDGADAGIIITIRLKI